MQKLTVLHISANPDGTEYLQLDKERREIQQKIQSSTHRDIVDFQYGFAVQSQDLLPLLNKYQPTIVHFSGHGNSEGQILLAGPGSIPKPIRPDDLSHLFSLFQETIKLVVLNCCYSQEQAEAIAKVIDCSIGMNALVSDEGAMEFIAAFYGALGFGKSVQTAFEQGRVALMLQGFAEENTPKMLVRRGIVPDSLQLIQPHVSANVKNDYGNSSQQPAQNKKEKSNNIMEIAELRKKKNDLIVKKRNDNAELMLQRNSLQRTAIQKQIKKLEDEIGKIEEMISNLKSGS